MTLALVCTSVLFGVMVQAVEDEYIETTIKSEDFNNWDIGVIQSTETDVIRSIKEGFFDNSKYYNMQKVSGGLPYYEFTRFPDASGKIRVEAVVRSSYDDAVDTVPAGQFYLGFENTATTETADVFMRKIYPMRITGATLTADAQFDSSAGTLNYQWQRSADGADWTDIVGATESTYTLNDYDIRKYIRVGAKGTAGAMVYSAATTQVTETPAVIESVIYNKPFTQANASWQINNPDVTAAWSETAGVEGDCGMLATSVKAGFQFYIYSPVTLKAGRGYRISADMKASAPLTGLLALDVPPDKIETDLYTDVTGVVSADVPVPAEYQTQSIEFKLKGIQTSAGQPVESTNKGLLYIRYKADRFIWIMSGLPKSSSPNRLWRRTSV